MQLNTHNTYWYSCPDGSSAVSQFVVEGVLFDIF
jgi:hypothetical protein